MARDRLPPLRALRALESFYLTGSVTATAQALNVSHSAVSHQLKQIEDWAGIRLIRREGRQAVLTEAGESLAQVANDSFGAIRHEIDRLTMRERLPVSVAAMRLVIPVWLLPEVNAFMESHPQVSVYVQEQTSDHPVTPEPDIAIGFSLGGELPANASRIIPGHAVPVASPAFLARHPVASLADIAAATLLHDEDMRMWNLWLAAAGLDADAERNERRRFFSGSALICEAALNGLGIALCREALIVPLLESGALVRLSDIRIDRESAYYLVLSHQGMTRLSAVTLFEWLLQAARRRFLAPP